MSEQRPDAFPDHAFPDHAFPDHAIPDHAFSDLGYDEAHDRTREEASGRTGGSARVPGAGADRPGRAAPPASATGGGPDGDHGYDEAHGF